MSELFTPEFIERQREIIKAATDGKWLVGRTPEVDAEQDYAGHYVGGFTGADVYDRDMGVYAMFFCDRDDETQIDPETICAPWSEADAEHIAEAHNHYPAALDEIERLRAELQAARADAARLKAALEEIHRLPLAPETRADMPYSLIANIDYVAKNALGVHDALKDD